MLTSSTRIGPWYFPELLTVRFDYHGGITQLLRGDNVKIENIFILTSQFSYNLMYHIIYDQSTTIKSLV